VSKSIRVVLADELEIIRHGVRLILEQVQAIRVVGEVGPAENAIELAFSLQPNVVVADVLSPDVIRRFKARNPNVRLLILTATSDHAYISSSLQAGADGYILKQGPSVNLVRAVIKLGQTEGRHAVLDPRINLKSQLDSDGSSDLLSNREREVLALVAAGHTSKGIAKQLRLSSRTIGNHRARILAKLQVDNCVQAAAQALQLGLISLPAGPGISGDQPIPGLKLKDVA
jgi:two-component system NarL family response regulator